MGSLYRRTYKAADGSTHEVGAWWIKYRDCHGVIRRESSETENQQEAKRLLKRREGAAAEGKVIASTADAKVTVGELLAELKTEYQANARRSLRRLGFAIQRLTPVFGAVRAAHLTTAGITQYKAQRQGEGAANATINRELAALKRALSLAHRAERIQRMPYIEMLA